MKSVFFVFLRLIGNRGIGGNIPLEISHFHDLGMLSLTQGVFNDSWHILT